MNLFLCSLNLPSLCHSIFLAAARHVFRDINCVFRNAFKHFLLSVYIYGGLLKLAVNIHKALRRTASAFVQNKATRKIW